MRVDRLHGPHSEHEHRAQDAEHLSNAVSLSNSLSHAVPEASLLEGLDGRPVTEGAGSA